MNNTASAVANFRPSGFSGDTLAFPPRHQTLNFRNDLEAKYQNSLGRPLGSL